MCISRCGTAIPPLRRRICPTAIRLARRLCYRCTERRPGRRLPGGDLGGSLDFWRRLPPKKGWGNNTIARGSAHSSAAATNAPPSPGRTLSETTLQRLTSLGPGTRTPERATTVPLAGKVFGQVSKYRKCVRAVYTVSSLSDITPTRRRRWALTRAALPTPDPLQVSARRSASLGAPAAALRRATPGGRRLPSRGIAVSAADTDPAGAAVVEPEEEVDERMPLEADVNVLRAWREQSPELQALWAGAYTRPLFSST